MVVWFIGLVGGFYMLFLVLCLMEFVFMFEYFVEDVMELLLFVCCILKVFDGVNLVS